MANALVLVEDVQPEDDGGRAIRVATKPGRYNEFYVRKARARQQLRQHILSNPGRYTAVDLSGITGISVGRINRLLSFDAEFKKLAQTGKVACSSKGGKPRWFNAKTPLVSDSFYRGAFMMTRFDIDGDREATSLARDIDDASRAALISSSLAPQTVISLQKNLRDRITEQADRLTFQTRYAKRMERRMIEAEKALAKLAPSDKPQTKLLARKAAK